MNKKVFVLDTNVLLHDPEAPSSFGSARIVLPIQVIEEIDRFKRDPSEKGRNSRRVARLLDGLRQRGNLADGVSLTPDGEGTLEVAFCRAETLAQLPPELRGGGGDNNILAVALEQMRAKGLSEPPEVVLITKDTNLRIKADAVGLAHAKVRLVGALRLRVQPTAASLHRVRECPRDEVGGEDRFTPHLR